MLEENANFDDFTCLEPGVVIGYIVLALKRAGIDAETKHEIMSALLYVLHTEDEESALNEYESCEY